MLNGWGKFRSICLRRIKGAESQDQRVDGSPRRVVSGARFAALAAPVPPSRAGVQEGVEDDICDRPSVGQGAALDDGAQGLWAGILVPEAGPGRRHALKQLRELDGLLGLLAGETGHLMSILLG